MSVSSTALVALGGPIAAGFGLFGWWLAQRVGGPAVDRSSPRYQKVMRRIAVFIVVLGLATGIAVAVAVG